MGKTVKVAACQVPDIHDDIDAALLWIEHFATIAGREGIRLLCFPECFLQGYLTEERQARHRAIDLASPPFEAILNRLTAAAPTLVLGLIEIDRGILFNTAVVVTRGHLAGRYRKTHLLAGEKIFQPGDACPVFEVDGLKFGINICFDTTFPESAAAIAAQGAKLIVCPSNNMMPQKKAEEFKPLHNLCRAARAKETSMWLISSDVTGQRDDRLALGPTCVIDPDGRIVAQVPLMEVGIVAAQIELD